MDTIKVSILPDERLRWTRRVVPSTEFGAKATELSSRTRLKPAVGTGTRAYGASARTLVGRLAGSADIAAPFIGVCIGGPAAFAPGQVDGTTPQPDLTVTNPVRSPGRQAATLSPGQPRRSSNAAPFSRADATGSRAATVGAPPAFATQAPVPVALPGGSPWRSGRRQALRRPGSRPRQVQLPSARRRLDRRSSVRPRQAEAAGQAPSDAHRRRQRHWSRSVLPSLRLRRTEPGEGFGRVGSSQLLRVAWETAR